MWFERKRLTYEQLVEANKKDLAKAIDQQFKGYVQDYNKQTLEADAKYTDPYVMIWGEALKPRLLPTSIRSVVTSVYPGMSQEIRSITARKGFVEIDTKKKGSGESPYEREGTGHTVFEPISERALDGTFYILLNKTPLAIALRGWEPREYIDDPFKAQSSLIEFQLPNPDVIGAIARLIKDSNKLNRVGQLSSNVDVGKSFETIKKSWNQK